MLDIGWQEFVLVAFVLLIVVGPKDLPKVLKTIVHFVRKVKSMAYDFQNSVDEIANESDINEIKKDITKIKESKSILSSKKDIETISQINDETKKMVEKNIKN